MNKLEVVASSLDVASAVSVYIHVVKNIEGSGIVQTRFLQPSQS